VDSSAYLNQAAFLEAKGLADQFLPSQASLVASLIDERLMFFLWFQVAIIGGGLVSRDTLYRIRPLLYAHPVRHIDYLVAKALVAFGLPFSFQMPFIFLPWLLSLLLAGASGPIWLSAPLYLIPAAGISSLLMASVIIGASSMASTPKAGMAWIFGVMIGQTTLAGILVSLVRNKAYGGISPLILSFSWPTILCGVNRNALVPLLPAIFATIAHVCLWVFISWWRTKPSEAVI
jgi:hypothetical protein